CTTVINNQERTDIATKKITGACLMDINGWKKSRRCRAPRERFTSMKSYSFTLRTWPRTNLANPGMFATPMAIMTLINPCPSTVINVMASRMRSEERRVGQEVEEMVEGTVM